MAYPSEPPRPDFSSANLVLVFVVMFLVFLLLWISYGLGPVVIAGVAINHVITIIEHRRNGRRETPPQR
ncbi:histidinol phosphate aminotransferase [Alloyangia pacifica]|uniref:Histidinol phosphate aminotransferase n=1 Tax=Alloyangia pacifica TaxID=311180 RepID=A0A2U8HDU3_9RHOB|nr:MULTISPECIES: histidinol phosphate aminotransferase [Roseobacteraceae]AWI83964.1 histidinol phosphate aminotransferase [Alloyangia pacifica]NDV51081.1 histidinol phosphate aminotransferase [Salipiger sp. PrR003]NDW33863.1 histidinol phosphate aminotransferase [Salipiger sp. PrR007]